LHALQVTVGILAPLSLPLHSFPDSACFGGHGRRAGKGLASLLLLPVPLRLLCGGGAVVRSSGREVAAGRGRGGGEK